MGLAYNPEARNDAFHVEYVVKTAGDRWFIPYNNNDTKANQVTQCDKMVGDTVDNSPAGSEMVA
tara:strand:+ start:150 stop:341 length:192 start_codon:yes stop_codon:yes gene_type:complete